MSTKLDEFIAKMLGKITEAGGFTRFRRATETPFNLILEAKP